MQAKAGDARALTQVCHGFQPLLRSVARLYRGVSYDDALQEGYVALLRAIQDYDVGRGIAFAGFAARRVHGDVRTAMRREWRNADRVVLNPDGHEEHDGQTPSLWDKLSFAAWRQDTGAGGDFSALEWRDLLRQAKLTEREAMAITLSRDGWSSTAIAKQMGMSAETVKTWRKRAFRKLRKALQEAELD